MNLLFPVLRSVQPLPPSRRGKMTVGKTPLKSSRRKQPRIIAQFPVEFRFRADGGNFQIVQGINSLGNECGVKVENATTDWKQFILATLNDARTSLSSDRRTLNRRQTNLPMDADKRNSDRRFQNLTGETSDDETPKVKVKKFLRNKATTY